MLLAMAPSLCSPPVFVCGPEAAHLLVHGLHLRKEFKLTVTKHVVVIVSFTRPRSVFLAVANVKSARCSGQKPSLKAEC